MSKSTIESGVIIMPDERRPALVPAIAQASNPSQLIALAIQKDFDVERLRELMSLEKEWRADQAKTAYAAAMVKFGNIKKVIGHNRSGTAAGGAKFGYSDFPTMVKAVTPWLAECGLSFSHHQDAPVFQDGGATCINVHCRVMHEAGHAEEVSFPAVSDQRLAGKLSPSQLIQLAITYAKRQTLSMLLGLATAEDVNDSDGAPPTESISDEQLANIDAMITELCANKAAFASFMKVQSLADLPASQYENAIAWLEAKRKKGTTK